jgi:SWI/SNF-related matrix-associated actin-dependent regulator of chromatin subfamily A member 5
MPKEDRSDWVAVAPEFSSVGDKIRPVTTAYQFFQRDVSEEVKAELGKGFKVFEFGKAVKEKYDLLDEDKRSYYEDLSYKDRMRFNQESHAADVAALKRRERLQQERGALLLDDEGGTKRSTRGGRAKKERKKERKEKRQQMKILKKIQNADEQDFVDEDEGSSDSYSVDSNENSSDFDSDDSDRPPKRTKKTKPRRQLSQKQVEYRKKMQEEKKMKESIIAERQADVRKENANQAKRRLDFLLKQSNIFSHFGQVKEDQAKYGTKAGVPRKSDANSTNRREASNDDDQQELDEADEHQATFLTAQPTTIGFGKMRQYQLEGLNWMIRLQENGVNGILADEVSCFCQKINDLVISV